MAQLWSAALLWSGGGGWGARSAAPAGLAVLAVFVAWFFATPVLYPASLAQANLPAKLYSIYNLNPMTGAITLVRIVFLGESPPLETLAISAVGTLIILAIGVTLFNRMSTRFPSAV